MKNLAENVSRAFGGVLPMGFDHAVRQALSHGSVQVKEAMGLQQLVRKPKRIKRVTIDGRVLHPTKGWYGAKKHGNRSNRT